MSHYPHKNLPLKKAKFDNRTFESQKRARLSSGRAPLKLVVSSEEKKKEVEEVCAEHHWAYKIDFALDNEEDISQLSFLLNSQVVATSTRIAGRNDPCPCRSGKKYKKCCAA